MSAELRQPWPLRRVEELFEIHSGITIGPGRAPLKRTRGYLRVANVQRSRIDLNDVMEVEELPGDSRRYTLEAGDLLIVEGHANPEEIGRCAVVNGESEGLLHQNHLYRLRGSRIIPRLAMELLNSTSVRRYWLAHTATSSGLYTINRRLLAALQLPDISSGEQHRITEIMDSVTECERVAEMAIVKLGTIRTSLIEKRLSAVECWEPLGGRLDRIEAGHSPNLPGQPASPGEWGVLKVSAIGRNGFRPTENKMVADRSMIDETCEVVQGDLLIARASTANLVGRTCLVKKSPYRLMLSDKTLRIVEKSNLADRQYINICFGMERVRRQIEGMSSGISQGMQNITQRSIEGIVLPWMSVELQRRFVAEVQSIDDRIGVETAALLKAKSLKEGLINDMLNGFKGSS
ncbi:hypothetical protein AB0D86_02455 [Streptomyces sp. NPDC048324]|uniref:restriction endonuclease subunit S n=1 Tax=Streptomyces sp. NPDC048324 TaxID=3157205 RepID=UPI00341E3741